MKKNSYSYDELINCGNGGLFGPGNAKLPLPPMLMFDRITEINDNNGAFKKGSLKAELDIKKDLWFFDCHFKEDPVMPGCLGLDAMWQLVGFFLGWIGNPGKGRALGVGAVKFTGEVLQNVKIVKYEIDMKKIMSPGGTAGLVDTIILCERKGKIGAVRWLRCLIGGQFILGGQRTPRGKFLEAADGCIHAGRGEFGFVKGVGRSHDMEQFA